MIKGSWAMVAASNVSIPRSGDQLANRAIPAAARTIEAPDQGGREIFLHIGTEKTGTSAIQQVGNRERSQLRKDGVCYPTTPGDNWHYKLALYVAGDAELRQMADVHADVAWEEFQKSFPEKLRTEIEKSECRRVVLSSEHLSSRIRSKAQVQQIADLLQPLGRVKVVCYVRAQHELFLSANSTFIKSGGTHYIEPPTDDTNPFYNYERMLAPWAAVFGDANIILRIYERERLKDNDIVSDFFSLLGFERYKSGATQMRINPSFDAKTLKFLMLINKHVPMFKDYRLNPERGDLVDAVGAISTEPSRLLSAEELRRIFALFGRSNAAVARRFLGRADGVLFANASFVGDGETVDLTVENAMEIAAHLWRWKSAHRDVVPSSSAGRDSVSTTPAAEVIAAAYRAILDRAPDPQGLEHYTRVLNEVPVTQGVESMLRGLVRSKEFREKHGADATEPVFAAQGRDLVVQSAAAAERGD
jgi:hypothetical protein